MYDHEAGVHRRVPSGQTAAMGFNPDRRRVARRTDIVFVIAAVVAVLALVAWALLG